MDVYSLSYIFGLLLGIIFSSAVIGLIAFGIVKLLKKNLDIFACFGIGAVISLVSTFIL